MNELGLATRLGLHGVINPTGKSYVRVVDVENGSQCLNAFCDLERIKS
jgi:hypothetical protein